ncbi:Low specificity L-threonine aldolase [Candidatus Terasakiella magnetica]|uniref:L-threonine aldolase n=1 Tax=Candidatus Terasakiella magnetica TaxID=1867952 RepID=A0A1C3RL96_9PROT|nr:low specificity L-threonine aldolase [Candidatus Terasakiella magnetica]SCA58018.1 Low specificity L-threonine aldolase [Candidatus Terasakiella magnetica]
MNFCSDNTTGVSPEILDALTQANTGTAMPYGEDELTAKVQKRFNEIFECETTVFLTSTGTSANALALDALTPSYGSIYCHKDSHINCDECGAPEMFCGGAKLITLPGPHGKLHPGELETALAATNDAVHHTQPAALSISQASEAGTIYGPAEIHHLSAVAKEYGLYFHMDGARFTNALCTVECSPAELTWKAGIDVLSFGATKNGAMNAEAIIFFNQKLAREVGYMRKRTGHLHSKMRFIAAQWDAFLTNDLWLNNARHANAMAQKLKCGLETIAGAELYFPVEANELFISLPENTLQALEDAGYGFYRWHDAGSPLIRLVTSFNTTEQDINGFIQTALEAS